MTDLSKHVKLTAIDRCFLSLQTLHGGTHHRGMAAVDAAIAMLEGCEASTHPTQTELHAVTVARESARRLRALRQAPPLLSFQPIPKREG
jgi:hypothetical protein